jgi:flagellar motor switch protein FliM
MKQENLLKLKVGDVITFTNKVNYFVIVTVTRIEEKSVYLDGHRNSYNTVKIYSKQFDFKINNQSIR